MLKTKRWTLQLPQTQKGEKVQFLPVYGLDQ